MNYEDKKSHLNQIKKCSETFDTLLEGVNKALKTNLENERTILELIKHLQTFKKSLDKLNK